MTDYGIKKALACLDRSDPEQKAQHARMTALSGGVCRKHNQTMAGA